MGGTTPIEATQLGGSPLVGRLHRDAEIARQAAFALFVLVYLEEVGFVPRDLRQRQGVEDLPETVGVVAAQNPHLLRFFGEPDHAVALGEIDATAARELIGWTAAQHVAREEPQIAYELAMLALSVELPGILVGSLRELTLEARSTVAELPDGSGYPTVFLSTLHPHWAAAECARLFVDGIDAEQLAGWAMLLLSKSLAPPPNSIVRVSAKSQDALHRSRCDVALVYNPVPWLGGSISARDAVAAEEVVVL